MAGLLYANQASCWLSRSAHWRMSALPVHVPIPPQACKYVGRQLHVQLGRPLIDSARLAVNLSHCPGLVTSQRPEAKSNSGSNGSNSSKNSRSAEAAGSSSRQQQGNNNYRCRLTFVAHTADLLPRLAMANSPCRLQGTQQQQQRKQEVDSSCLTPSTHELPRGRHSARTAAGDAKDALKSEEQQKQRQTQRQKSR